MHSINVKFLSTEPHVSQVLSGFQLLHQYGDFDVTFEDCSGILHGTYVEALYCGKQIFYDVLDGYQYPDEIAGALTRCDYYWKRSYSEPVNRELALPHTEKMRPLGLNYHVSCKKHPIDPHFAKESVKRILGLNWNNYRSTYFTSSRFEETPHYKRDHLIVLFMTRLWEGYDEINAMRIGILRKLLTLSDIDFIGGLPDSAISRRLAPDLIMDPAYTNRAEYLKLMHKSDICIGSSGLYDSIGWKTGEYVAAAKAIVNEKLHYTVPGDFTAGKNYLEFDTADGCVENVERLLSRPDLIFEMKKANYNYYQSYLRPDVLIRRTLDRIE